MKVIVRIALVALFLCAVPAPALAFAPVESTGAELVTAGSGLDGVEVTFEGEVISEALAGGQGHVWLNVLSGGVAIGVWMPEQMAERVETFGMWSHDGDIVRITGVLNEACDTHGGDLDVHATGLEVITSGTPREHQVKYWKLAVGLVALAAAYVIIRQAWRREERPS
ncbi:MAG: hypothetical protein RBS17_06465 [Coriobacteriia bacterium]|nr:hypothetical protein [Coriobacteriia bacterium]